MKVRLLKEVGIHTIGTILDVDNTIVLQLEKDGTAEILSNIEAGSKADNVVYTDNTGKTYTEEEVASMDKRTNLYKEIKANSK